MTITKIDAADVWDGDLNQHKINENLKLLLRNFVTPEMFGAVANDTTIDNTEALNNAFATGCDIYSTPDKTYSVTKNLRTKGQRLIGGWKIHSKKNTSREHLWEKTVTTVDDPNVNTDVIKMMYVANAYDLSEFLYIKSLGFNTLQHYSGMSIQGWDNDGDVLNMLDNAKSAGLKVIVGTQNDPLALADLTAFVSNIDSHSAVIGYSANDEPVWNGKTIAEQDERISIIRAVSNKLVTAVEFTIDPLTKRMSDNYDIIFLDIYNDKNQGMSEADAIQADLYKMRAALGLYNRQYKCTIIPVVMGFKYVDGAPLSRIINTSKIFAKACGGNFGTFVWDGDAESSIETSIRNSTVLDKMCLDICAYRNLKYSIPTTLLWGYINNSEQTNWGLKDVLEHQILNDPNTIDTFNGLNSYPTQVSGNNSINSDHLSTNMSVGTGMLAIWFKKGAGAYCSDVQMKKHNYLCLHSGTIDSTLKTYLNVVGSSTGGYGLGSSLVSIPVNGTVNTVTFTNNAEADLFCIKYDATTEIPYYRTYIRGLYVTSDW
ncbi:hypothetical protein [Acinetobacter colistiniresistens]|uniref:hypothetical protein n=1 Tax=Acinetobacter colistiniresistens TaxID=280145 RepID=UPI001250198C|nr:hypothetical protein [Acinetobacter colistiniresistens]